MKRFGFLLFLLGLHEISFAQTLKSPNGRFDLQFAINAEGRPTYQLKFDGKDVVKTSGLGLELKKEKADKQETFDNSQHTDASTIDVKADMMYGFQLKDQQTSTFDETWKPVWHLFYYQGRTHAVCADRRPHCMVDSRRLRHARVCFHRMPTL